MRIIALILVIVGFISCNPKESIPEDILPQSVMVKIYEDIRILEGAKFTARSDTSLKIDSDAMYLTIMEKNKTTADKFKESHDYYITKPYYLAEIFEKVEENLHERKARADAQANGGKK